MLMEVLEKKTGLGRHPVPLAGLAMKPEIGFDGLQVGGEPDGHALLLGFPDVAAGGFAQAFEEQVRPRGEIEEVMGKLSKGLGRGAGRAGRLGKEDRARQE